jgi:hypothetical protein
MKNKTVNELNRMSKEITGVASKWRKLMENGEIVEAMETVNHLSIKDGKEAKEKMDIPYLKETENGQQIPVYTLKRYDLEGVKAKLLEIKAQQDKFREMIRQLEEQAKVKEQVKEELVKNSGSAVKL